MQWIKIKTIKVGFGDKYPGEVVIIMPTKPMSKQNFYVYKHITNLQTSNDLTQKVTTAMLVSHQNHTFWLLYEISLRLCLSLIWIQLLLNPSTMTLKLSAPTWMINYNTTWLCLRLWPSHDKPFDFSSWISCISVGLSMQSVVINGESLDDCQGHSDWATGGLGQLVHSLK